MTDKKQKRQAVYPLAFKRKILAEINSGEITISEAKKKCGIKSDTTIQNWKKQVARGTSYTRVRISRPERIKYVTEILNGFKTVDQVMEETNLKSKDSIKGWIKQYDEELSLTEAHKTIAENQNLGLSEELTQAKLKILALECLIKNAEEHLNYPIRKKFGTKQ